MRSPSKALSPRRIAAFRRTVYRGARLAGRDFPWRRTSDPYRILVSEVMLQQTGAERVVPFYRAFLRSFPSVRALARAPLRKVLSLWSGLGYNRRALSLRALAREVVSRHEGKIPADERKLRDLPGVGPYTAAAVVAFAWDAPAVVLDTNIRGVFIRHFFPGRRLVADRDLLPLVEKTLDRRSPRRWYAALMDYGSRLKRRDRGLTLRSRHYVRQLPFRGSRREARGAIVRALLSRAAPFSERELLRRVGVSAALFREALAGLVTDGVVSRGRGRVAIR